MKKRIIFFIFAFLVLGLLFDLNVVSASSKIKLSKSSITITEGQTKKIKVKNNKKKLKVKWKSKNKKIATVSKKGVITAKKAGKTKIIAKIGKKNYICKVKVVAKKKPIEEKKPERPQISVDVIDKAPYKGRYVNYSGNSKTFVIDDIKVQAAYDEKTGTYFVWLVVAGERDGASSISESMKVGWKLMNQEGAVIDSGYIATPEIAGGERFANVEEQVASYLSPGAYSISFYIYRE